MAITAVEQITVAPQGEPGPLFYPVGVWSQQGEYARTKDTCPFVLYDTGNTSTSFYYYLTKEGSYKYNKDKSKEDFGTPPESAAANGVWKQLTNVGYVFTNFLMANHALLAGAVAYNNQMFSQLGTVNGVSSGAYTNSNFVPNLLLDWSKGLLKCNNAEIRGHVEATSGSFTGEINAESGSFSGYVKSLFSEIDSKICTYTYVSTEGRYFWKLNKHLNIIASHDNLLLPSDASYIGSNVKIFNPHFIQTRVPSHTSIQIESGDILTGFRNYQQAESDGDHPYEVQFSGGLLEFVGVPGTYRGIGKCGWHCINYGPSVDCIMHLKNGKTIVP